MRCAPASSPAPDILLETNAEGVGNWVMGDAGAEPEQAKETDSAGIGIDFALYEVSLDGSTGGIHLVADGALAGTLDGKGIDLNLALRAPDLRVLGVLGGADLPPVGPVDVRGRLRDIEGGYRVTGLQAKAGDTDLGGEASVVHETRPMRVRARLTGTRLDLSPFEREEPGAAAGKAPKPQADAAEAPAPDDRVFPDDPLPFDRLKEVDADFHLDAKRVEMRARDLKDVVVALKLDGGKGGDTAAGKGAGAGAGK